LIGRSENQFEKMVKRRRNLFKTPSLLDDSSEEDIGEELSLTQGTINSPAAGTLMNSGKLFRDDESTSELNQQPPPPDRGNNQESLLQEEDSHQSYQEHVEPNFRYIPANQLELMSSYDGGGEGSHCSSDQAENINNPASKEREVETQIEVDDDDDDDERPTKTPETVVLEESFSHEHQLDEEDEGESCHVKHSFNATVEVKPQEEWWEEFNNYSCDDSRGKTSKTMMTAEEVTNPEGSFVIQPAYEDLDSWIRGGSTFISELESLGFKPRTDGDDDGNFLNSASKKIIGRGRFKVTPILAAILVDNLPLVEFLFRHPDSLVRKFIHCWVRRNGKMYILWPPNRVDCQY